MERPYRYAVGELFEPSRRSHVDGTARFGLGMLVIFMASPTEEEIAAIRLGRMRLGMAEAGGCLFVLYEIEGLTGDAPYEWHLASERVRPEPLSGRQRLLICVFLVDAATGLIRAMRQTTMSPRVSAALVRAIERQSQASGFDEAGYDERLQRAYARWTFRDLVRLGMIDPTGLDVSGEIVMGRWSAIDADD